MGYWLTMPDGQSTVHLNCADVMDVETRDALEHLAYRLWVYALDRWHTRAWGIGYG